MNTFDETVYAVARDYGRWVYLASALAFIALATWVTQRIGARKTAAPKLSDALLMQVAMLLLLVAFAMQTGRYPVVLSIASFAIAIGGWLVCLALIWADNTTVGQAGYERRSPVITALVLGSRPHLFQALGIAQSIIGVGIVGIFIWGVFAHDPSRFGDGAHVARLAIIFLIIPAIAGGLITLMILLLQVASKHATHGYRNMMFAAAVMTCISQSIMIFGPPIFLRREFEALGIAPTSNIAVIVVGGLIITLILIIPYFIGFLSHVRMERELQDERREIFERAAHIATWKDCEYKDEQIDELKGRVLNQYQLLQGNPFLAYLGLELLLLFVSVGGGEQAAREQIVEPLVGEGGASAIESRKAQMREALATLPAQLRSFFEIVDGNDWGDLRDASPLVPHFYEIMLVLPRLLDAQPDLEYVAKDLLANQEKPTLELQAARPAILFTVMSSAAPQLWRLFGDEFIVWLRGAWVIVVRLANAA